MTQNSLRKELVLGALFLVAIVFLVFVSILISKLNIFSNPQYVKVVFESVSGLKKGDPVRVLGMESGVVYRLKILPDNRVKVWLKLSEPIELREDCKITVEESSLLGGNFIGIDPGTFGKNTINPKSTIEGKVVVPGLSAFGKFIEENQDDVKKFLSDGIKIITDAAEGKGTLGKFIKDDSLYMNLKDSTDSIKNTAKKVESGQGNLGQFIADDKLYIDLKESVESLKKTLKQIESNQGLLGKVIYDEKLAQQVTDAGDTVLKLLEPVVRTKVYAGVDYKYYPESKEGISDIFIRIEPRESRYFLFGGSIFMADKNSQINIKNDEDIFKFHFQVAYKFNNNNITFRTGLLEGKFGGAFDLDKPISQSLISNIAFTYEIRDTYNSVKTEKIDENLSLAMNRAYVTVKFGNHLKVYTGASRIFSGTPEFMVGFLFEYLDEDIKSFVTLLGIAR